MRKPLTLLTATMLVALVLGTTPASAAGAGYGFRLGTPNVAAVTDLDEHHQPGDTIRLTGSGWFDPTTGAVSGGGSFVHFREDGTVHMRGTWEASGFGSFTPFGAPRNGKLGGVLQLTTIHLGEDGMGCEHGAVPMTITSGVRAPAGTIAGTTTGPFGQVVSGAPTFSVA